MNGTLSPLVRAGWGLSCLTLLVGLAGCINPAYLASAKDSYELRHGLKKPAPSVPAGQVTPGADQKTSHPPYWDRECGKCHDQSKGGEFRARGEELCYLCHPRSAFHHERIHGPVAAGECSSCHVSHENTNPYHTTAPLPALCLGCHSFDWGDSGGLKDGYFIHQAVREGRCAKCHDPHGGSLVGFLKAEPAHLCLGCHTGKQYSNGVVHGPLAVKDCLTCHEPHASKTRGLLKAPATADLCFECHPPSRPKCTAAPDERDCLRCHDPHQVKPGDGPSVEAAT